VKRKSGGLAGNVNRDMQRLRNRIRGEFRRSLWSARSALEQARGYPSQTFAETIALAYPLQAITHHELLARRISGPKQLFGSPHLSPLPLKSELEWAFQQLIRHKDLLSEFRKNVAALSWAFFANDVDTIQKLLDLIAAASGESCWLIEARLAILQSTQGLESQRRYASQVAKHVGPTLLNPILYFVGQRNEELVSMQRFTSRVATALMEWGLPAEIDTYLRYKLVGLIRPNAATLSTLISVSATGSIVDLYETLVDVFSYLIITESVADMGTATIVRRCLTSLTPLIRDSRLQQLLRLLDCQFTLDKQPSTTCALRRIVTAARSAISVEPNTPSDSLEGRIVKNVAAIFHRDATSEASAQDLLKFSLNHGFLVETVFLHTIASGFRSDSGRAYRNAARSFAIHDDRPPNSDRTADYPALSAETMSHPLASLYRSPDGSSAHYEIEAHIEKRHLNEATELVNLVSENEDPFDRHQCVRYRYYIARAEDRWWDAMSSAVNERIDHPGFRTELLLSDILKGRKWQHLRQYERDGRLAIGIFMAIAEESDGSDSDLPAMLIQAMKRILAAHGVESFSLLEADSLGLSKQQFIFFLRNVCVDSYLVGNPAITTSRALAQERILIGRCLLSLDPINVNAYGEEVRELTYRLELQEGVDTFDRSRVFVNLDGIRRWARRSMREDFLRFQSLVDADSANLTALVDALAKLRGNSPLPPALLQELASESDKVLVDILRRLRDQYLSSPEDGLDVFLSLRIRHGSLSGHLRGPLEEASLLTLRDEASGAYKPNQYWAERLSLASDTEAQMHAAFSHFSLTIDSAIHHLLRDIIQLRSKDAPDGAFEIILTSPIVNFFKAQITTETNFEEFLSLALDSFAIFLGPCLIYIKKALQQSFKGIVDAAVERLRRDLAECFPRITSANLATAIGNASTNIAIAIDRVTEWFSPDPLRDSARVYSVETLVQMGIHITRRAHQYFEPAVDLSVEAGLPGFQMATGAMVVLDVVYTLLDNVARHSGFPNGAKVKLRVSMPDDNHLVFEMHNEVRKGVRTSLLEDRLERLRGVMKTGGFTSSTASEGGSGLIKLKRIGSTFVEGSRTDLRFGFAGDTTFEVRVAIPTRIETIGKDLK
jgi:hypothetical protein